MKIIFYQKDGKIGARYEVNDEETERLSCLIPLGQKDTLYEGDIGILSPHIQKKSSEEIWKYTERKCRRHHRQCIDAVRKAYHERCHRMDNVNRVIEAECDGIELKGRIVNHSRSRAVRVTLEEPYRSKKSQVFSYPNSFAEAMGGARVFDERTGELTQKVLGDAEEVIIELYQEERAKRLHPKAINLVESLNQRKATSPQAMQLVKELNKRKKKACKKVSSK